MTEREKMQQLHHRASVGEKLTADEERALQNWYDELDREEDLLINKNAGESDMARLREQLNAKLAELSQAAQENERIARENEVIRRENERLRQAVESRLLEKVA